MSKFGLRFRSLDIRGFHVDKMNKRPHVITHEEDKGIVSMLIDMILLAQSYIHISMLEQWLYILPHSNCYMWHSQKAQY